jgi:hypothetical protein
MFWGLQMCLKMCVCDLHSSGAGYGHVMISRDHSHDPSPALEYLDQQLPYVASLCSYSALAVFSEYLRGGLN